MNKNNSQKNIDRKDERGLTILFAVLVSILVLAVGTSIINLSLKQVLLSGSARESQFAFYASNTGVECALYWDIQGGPTGGIVFATSSASALETGPTVTCAEKELSTNVFESNNTSASTKFRLEFNEVPYCVDVVVTKDYNAAQGKIYTTIDSYGYNTCDTDNARRIERGLQVNY